MVKHTCFSILRFHCRLKNLVTTPLGPGPVSGLTALPQFTFILLTWNPPEDPNGKIAQYEITYRIGRVNPDVDSSGLINSYAISQLQPQTRFEEVTVTAYNDFGKGEVSRLMDISTLEAPRKYCLKN
jgi:hypothetical protein